MIYEHADTRYFIIKLKYYGFIDEELSYIFKQEQINGMSKYNIHYYYNEIRGYYTRYTLYRMSEIKKDKPRRFLSNLSKKRIEEKGNLFFLIALKKKKNFSLFGDFI